MRLLGDTTGVGIVGVFVGALLLTILGRAAWDLMDSTSKAGRHLNAMVPVADSPRVRGDVRPVSRTAYTGPVTDSGISREIQRAAQKAYVVLSTPVNYSHVSSEFSEGRRHPITGRVTPHLGTDFAAPAGTEIWSAAAGQVTFVGAQGGDGNMVIIDHGGGFTTSYSHMSAFARGLRVGDWVGDRQIIGYVGSTGMATGPHLHFAVQYYNRFIDFQQLAKAW